jgi:acid phosphatase family membrane protein YuiD
MWYFFLDATPLCVLKEVLILEFHGICLMSFTNMRITITQVLNKIVEDLFEGHPISERKLKELLGHTPSQVFAGAILGILVAWYCCQGCIVPV